MQDEYGDVVTVTAGTVLHDALENRVLEVREELGMGVRADPRDGGEPVEIPEYGGLRGERYAVLAP